MKLINRYNDSQPGIMRLKYLLSFPDIRYCAYPFPTGRLYIFGNRESIKMIFFGNDIDHKNDVEKNFRDGTSGEIGRAIKFFDCYLLGKECPHPELDMLPFTSNEKKIYNALKKVGFGKTVTYGALAKKAGMPYASRFVGNAMAKNFFPLIIPCHRVVKYGGGIGGFSSGKGTKNFLLQHEKVFCK